MSQSADNSASWRWRFEDVEFDESRMTLSVDGVPAAIEPKPLQLLAELLRHVNEAVTREELFDSLWVGQVTVDHVLASAVNRLRKALGPAAAARFFGLYAPVEPPMVAVDTLSSALAAHLPISVLVSGMGEDMHTASLFPGGAGLQAALADNAPVLTTIHAEAAGEARVTLTAPVLRAARHKHVLITGEAKRVVLERAASLPADQAPISVVLPDATVHWAP